MKGGCGRGAEIPPDSPPEGGPECSLACAIRRFATGLGPCGVGCVRLEADLADVVAEISRYRASPYVPAGRCPAEVVSDMGVLVAQLIRHHGWVQVDQWTLRRPPSR